MEWWFDSSVLDDWTDGSSRTELSPQEAKLKERAEASQAHAEYRIKNHRGTYDQVDAILALKRSMQTRLDHLDSIYGFKQYPQSRSAGWLGLLDEWGVIRKRVLRRMSQLRNAVEHDGAEPPGIDECEDYAEVNWWFLRATTPLLRPMMDLSFSFEEYDLSLDFNYNPLLIKVRGNFLPEMLSDSELAGWISVEAVVSEKRKSELASKLDHTEKEKLHLDGKTTTPESALPLIQRSFQEFI